DSYKREKKKDILKLITIGIPITANCLMESFIDQFIKPLLLAVIVINDQFLSQPSQSPWMITKEEYLELFPVITSSTALATLAASTVTAESSESALATLSTTLVSRIPDVNLRKLSWQLLTKLRQVVVL
ncbi:31126_t:CDS:2, partial [Racocetra persica]